MHADHPAAGLPRRGPKSRAEGWPGSLPRRLRLVGDRAADRAVKVRMSVFVQLSAKFSLRAKVLQA